MGEPASPQKPQPACQLTFSGSGSGFVRRVRRVARGATGAAAFTVRPERVLRPAKPKHRELQTEKKLSENTTHGNATMAAKFCTNFTALFPAYYKCPLVNFY